MTEKLSYSRAGLLIFVLALTVMLGSSYLLAADPVRNSTTNERAQKAKISNGAENGAGSELALYRIETLRDISAEQGKKYLAEVDIGTVSQLPSPNTLLITAQQSELVKASAILKLVDSKERFVIKTLFPASEAKNLPSNEQIATEVGDISIGTFSNPPTLTAKTRAIIDIHNDAVIVIAPAGQIEKIITAIERGPILQKDGQMETQQLQSGAAGPVPRAPNEPPDANKSDEFFSKLLDSLSAAEKIEAELAKRPVEPNESGTAVAVPEQKVPSKLFAGSEQIKEAFFQAVKQPQEPNLAAIAEDLAAKKVVAKPEPEAKRAPVLEPAPIPEKKREVETQVAEPVPKVRSYEPEPIANGEEVLKLNLPEKLTIVDFLGFVGEYLHLDYMYDPVKVKGDVTLKLQGKLRGPIKVKDLYPLLESVLKFKGFVMARKGNLVTIVPASEAYNIDPALLTDRGKVELGDVIISRIFNLKHIDAASAKNLLDGMKLGVSVNTSASTVGALIVTGYAYRMGRIEELLQMIDKPGEPKQFGFRQLKYTMAKTLAPKIKTLAEQLGTVSIAISAAPPATVTRKAGETTAAFRARQAKASAAARAAAARAPAAAGKPTVYLDADERTNRILMIGLEEQLVIVKGLIDVLDVEQQDLRTLRLYGIQRVGAEEVVEKLKELGIISGGPATSRVPAGAKTPGPKPPSTTTAEALVEEPQVVIIETTNSLLVNATAEQHLRIATIIGYVDCETEEALVPYMVYPLENQDPTELATVLNQLIQETTTREEKGAKIVTTRKKIEEEISIIPEPKTYSLIVYASKKNQQWISSLIKQLDEYRPQVLLDVTLVEITKNDEFNLDLNLISSFPDLVDTSGLTGTIIGGESPITSKSIIDKLSSFKKNRFIDLQSDGGEGTGFYADRHINVLLTAMQKKGYGRVLASPKLLVNDNEKGTIKSEETIHITREKVTYRKGAVGVEDIPIMEKQFDAYNAGITLDIEPHISKGDQLRLTITMTRKDFRITEEVKTEKKPPDIVTSDVATVVTVPDSRTIILGGLERISQSKGGTKVPILGDIPLLGGLFRSTANTDSQSRLYVFVKAHILRPGEKVTGVSDIELVSAKNRDTFERYEKEMQDYEDWPGIKPKPMDPVQVLEAD